MYEWKTEFKGYDEKEAKEFRDLVIETGGVAILHRMEGYEMGSGPHFQGYTVQYIDPIDLRNHIEMPTQPPVDRERYIKNCQDETKDDCKCGHPYYRHFDSYEPGLPHIGCKYCYCGTFEEPVCGKEDPSNGRVTSNKPEDYCNLHVGHAGKHSWEAWCNCGTKTMQGEYHKPGCPARVKYEQSQGRVGEYNSG